jgi:RecB family exonuclease
LGHNEVAFRYAVEGVVLEGVIDRLARDPSTGGWLVLDYKTTFVAGDLLEQAAAYRHQLLTYALAASALQDGDERPCAAALYFSEPGALVRLPPFTPEDQAELRGLLAGVSTISRGEKSWPEVEREAISTGTRPCVDCGFRRRGCRGQETVGRGGSA